MHKKIATAVIRDFNRYYTNILGLVNQHILQSPLSLSEVRVLYEIHQHPGATARSIRNTLQIDEGYLSRILDHFIQKGWLKRSRSAADARVYILFLTAKGGQQFNQLNKAAEQEISKLIAELPEARLQRLVKHMQGIKSILSGNKN